VATNPDLEARILSNPDDLDAYAVYGDWLSEQGDPRGELVAIQLKRVERPDDPTLIERQTKLLADHAKVWLGELAELDSVKDLSVTWRHGFVSAVQLGPPLNKHATSKLDFPGTLEKLFALPNIALLRELVIGSKDNDDYPTSWSDCVEAIAKHGAPTGLTKLVIDRGGYWDISSTELGDVSPMFPVLYNLRELELEMNSIELGEIDLPELRSLEIRTGALDVGNLESIRTGKLPKLEKLVLYLGETGGDYGGNVELDDLKWILAAEELPGVRHLGLANSSISDEIADALVASKILAQLTKLDLSRGTLSDRGATAMLDHADAFAHLVEIDLSRSYLSDDVRARLQKLGPRVITEGNQGPEDEDRYVSIGE
jgi:uncharacterized protein (TIGR02996 family)